MKNIDEISSMIRRGNLDGAVDVMVDQVISNYELQFDSSGKEKGKNIVITGYPRVGKSLIANKLSGTGKWVLVSMDQFRRPYWESTDPMVRIYVRINFILKLVMKLDKGLLLEGDELLTVNRASFNGIHPITSSYFSLLRGLLGFNCFVVGNALCSVDEKVKGMENWARSEKCWAVDKGSVNKVAEDSIRFSREVKDYFMDSDVIYIDISPENFDADVEKAFRLIESS